MPAAPGSCGYSTAARPFNSRSSSSSFLPLLVGHGQGRPAIRQRVGRIDGERHTGMLRAEVAAVVRAGAAAAVTGPPPMTMNCGRLSLTVPSP